MKPRVARRMSGVQRTLIRQMFDSAPPDAVNLGLGQPDLATPSEIAMAGIAGIVSGKTGYTTTAGEPDLRTAVASRYRTPGRGPDNVVVTVGSQEALFASLLALTDPGDEVLFPDPGYPAYATVARLIGTRAVPYPLHVERGFRLEPRDIASRLTERTRVVIVCSPSNPTGAVASDDSLRELAGALERRGVAWISDEIYAGFCYEGPPASLAKHAPDGGVVISGLSKDLSMTGWRIGWAIGPADLVSRVTAAHQYLVTCAPSISQAAAIVALGPHGERHREARLERFRRRRARMATELERISGLQFELPDGAFYFFVRVDGCSDSLALSEAILEQEGVVTIPGVAFGAGGEGFLRLSYAASEDDIVAGVRGIGRVLDNAANDSWRVRGVPG